MLMRGSDNICGILTSALSASPDEFLAMVTSAVRTTKHIIKWEIANMHCYLKHIATESNKKWTQSWL